jgi:hypothetical protein
MLKPENSKTQNSKSLSVNQTKQKTHPKAKTISTPRNIIPEHTKHKTRPKLLLLAQRYCQESPGQI